MNRASFVCSSASAIAAVIFLRDVALGSEGSGYASVMAPLVETILPFGAPAFPSVVPEQIVSRISNLYGLDKSPIFLASLAAFSDVSSFGAGSRELFDAELATAGGLNIDDLTRQDASALQSSGLGTAATFEGLGADARIRYLRLWEQSAFNTRRRFYGSVRAITFAAFYSMPESWNSIEYAGPLLKRRSVR